MLTWFPLGLRNCTGCWGYKARPCPCCSRGWKVMGGQTHKLTIYKSLVNMELETNGF